MGKLLESEFKTMNLKALFGKQPSDAAKGAQDADEPDDAAGNAQTMADDEAPKKYPPDFDWGGELKRRLEANRELSRDARESEYDIEKRFWFEYFSTGWNKKITRNLMQIDSLWQAIKILGFDPKTNPILAFIKQAYVQKELLQTNLLNINTYKAIHQAVIKRYIADSEFLASSDYNILYCKDLYTKTPDEMLKYFEEQSHVLPSKSGKYTAAMQAKNRRTFLLQGQPEKNEEEQANKQNAIPVSQLPSVKTADIKLQSLAFVRYYTKRDHGGPGRTFGGHPADAKDVAKHFDTPAKVLAAIQYISMTTGSTVAKAALEDSRLSGVSIEDLRNATVEAAAVFGRVKVSKNDADAFVQRLLDTL